jgi:hypothetical protein
MFRHHVGVQISRDCVVRRRDFLRGISAAGLAAGTLSWTDMLSARADELRREGMACIVLWMQGGPSQFETFSPKQGHANGGETKAIKTSVPGIEIAENLPRVAGVMDDVAVIRSMTSKEGSHRRASFLLHTGYLPTPTVKYPSLGSIASHQIESPQCDLPGFVRIGGRDDGDGGGLLGVEFDPFHLQAADRPPQDTTPATDSARFRRRLGLLDRLEADYAQSDGAREAADHKKLYGKTAKMILSSQMKAFELEQEPAAMRDAYGRTPFGSGCLLARRLVETGVTCVEVNLGNWDTHADNFNRSRQLAGQFDKPMAQIITDLKQRGMLERTLVVWMGEFGRTPRINPRAGRDHFPRAFNVALAGGGVRGGQVIGATDAGGNTVAERPVTVPDLFRSFCRSLKIDPEHENMSDIGRPIKIVDEGSAVDELFS